MTSQNSPESGDPAPALTPASPGLSRAPLLLEVRNLQVRRGRHPALTGVSFDVASGSTTAIIGSAGAGKTTLLHALSGLADVTAGSIRFRGQELTSLPSHRICDLGIAHVPEGRQLFPTMSVRENLELGASSPRARKGRHQRLDQMLALFPRLAAAIDQDAGALSAGEQQLVAFGRCLMARPELILFDEPARGLSPALARQLFLLIGTLEAEGLTIILAERNASAALRLADSAHILDRGRIVLSGSGLALLEDQRVREAYF